MTFNTNTSTTLGTSIPDIQVVAGQTRDYSTDLLETRELVEEHTEHHLVGLRRQVGEEEDLVGRGVVHSARSLRRHHRSASRRTRLHTRHLL